MKNDIDEICTAVKSQLERAYDIPFHIEGGDKRGDLECILWPVNDLNELFEIHMLYRQRVRLIIDVSPQRYAVGMLDDMQKAGGDKIDIFLKYIGAICEMGAKVEASINDNLCKKIVPELWDYPWKSFKFRISVIPELDDSMDCEKNLFVRWSNYVVGMMLSLLNIEKIEYIEGGLNQVLVNKYERNPVNRQLCLMANGYICKICGFDFEKMYGDLGRHFIHVHHIEMVSSHKKGYYLNPEKDLIPVCPNCHAMLHRRTPPLDPDVLKEIIQTILVRKKGN